MSQSQKRRWPWITGAVILLLLGLYTALGFWGLPYLIKSKLPAALEAQTGQKASLGAVSFNPFTLRLEAHDFVLGPGEPKPLASFRRLVVELGAASLWRWGPHLPRSHPGGALRQGDPPARRLPEPGRAGSQE